MHQDGADDQRGIYRSRQRTCNKIIHDKYLLWAQRYTFFCIYANFFRKINNKALNRRGEGHKRATEGSDISLMGGEVGFDLCHASGDNEGAEISIFDLLLE